MTKTLFSPLKNKIYIFTPPCNNPLCICHMCAYSDLTFSGRFSKFNNALFQQIIKKKAKRRLDFGSSSYKQRKKKRPNQPSANKTKIQEDSTETRASTKVEGQGSEAFCEPSRGIEVTPNKNSQEKKATDLEEVSFTPA